MTKARKVYETFTRKNDADEWKLSFVNYHHVIAHKKEQFAQSRGLQFKTEVKKVA